MGEKFNLDLGGEYVFKSRQPLCSISGPKNANWIETGEIEGGNPERNSDEKFLRTP